MSHYVIVQFTVLCIEVVKSRPGSPNVFFSVGHINYYTKVRGPDILRNVIVLEQWTYVAFCKIKFAFF